MITSDSIALSLNPIPYNSCEEIERKFLIKVYLIDSGHKAYGKNQRLYRCCCHYYYYFMGRDSVSQKTDNM